MPLRRSFLWLLANAGPTALVAQHLTRAEGANATSLDIRVLEEAQPGSPGQVVLQNVELIPIELTGHTLVQDSDFRHTRVARRAGFGCVQLPDGGRLFRYRRQAGRFWGFLHVLPDGDARAVLEIAGVGASGLADPFADRIGVAPDGRFAAAMLAAGGCCIVRLDGTVFAATGASVRQVATAGPVLAASMLVGRSFAFFRTASGGNRLWRMSLDDGAPVDMTPPMGLRDVLGVEMAMSGDGSTVAFALGPRAATDIWLLDETNPPRQLPTGPIRYEEPQYLPEGNGSAVLLLDATASRLFYFDGNGNEMFLLDATATAGTPFHFSGDDWLSHTIGVHIMPSFVGTTLVLAMGDVAGGALRTDWFQVDVSGAGNTLVNLTKTGSLLPPYQLGSLTPRSLAVAGGRVLSTEGTGTPLTLRCTDLATQQTHALFTDLTALPTLGGAFDRAPDLLCTGVRQRVLHAGTGAMFAQLPPGARIVAPSGGPDYSAALVQLPAGFGLAAVYLDDGTVIAGDVRLGLQQVVQTRTGAVVIQAATSTQLLRPSSQDLLPLPQTVFAVFLSGA
jgi:hypothetical protein